MKIKYYCLTIIVSFFLISNLFYYNGCCAQDSIEFSIQQSSFEKQIIPFLEKKDWLEIKNLSLRQVGQEQNAVAVWILGYVGLETKDYVLATKCFSFINSKQTQKLIDFSNRLMKKLPLSSISYILMGDAISRNGNFFKAIESLNSAIEIDKSLSLAYEIRGSIYFLSGDLENATQDFQTVLVLDKYNADAYFNLGNIYLLKNDLILAQDYFNQALINAPNFGLAFNGRGIVSLYNKDIEMAFYDFQTAYEFLSDYIEYKNLKLLNEFKSNDEFDTYFKDLEIDKRGSYIQTSNIAKPGDLIVRHGEGILGPPITGGILDDIPHIGMVSNNNKVYHLEIENVKGENHGIMHIEDLNTTTSFKNPGFFSVLESDIPIKYEEKLMTFKDLPQNKKETIRNELNNLANSTLQNENLRDKGKYSFITNNCGEPIMHAYDKVLKENHITVQRYEGISSITKDKKGLVNGNLKDWFTSVGIMDPSQANDRLPRRSMPNSQSEFAKNSNTPNYWVDENNNSNAAKSLVSMVDRGASFDKIPKNVVVYGKGENADVMVNDFKQKGWNVTVVHEYKNFDNLQTIAKMNNAIISGVKSNQNAPEIIKDYEFKEPKYEPNLIDRTVYKSDLHGSNIDPRIKQYNANPPGGVLMKVVVVKKEKANVDEMFGIKQEQRDSLNFELYNPLLLYCGR